MKQQFETDSGMSLDGVQLHFNSGKLRQMQVFAYTQADHAGVAMEHEQEDLSAGGTLTTELYEQNAPAAASGQPFRPPV